MLSNKKIHLSKSWKTTESHFVEFTCWSVLYTHKNEKNISYSDYINYETMH